MKRGWARTAAIVISAGFVLTLGAVIAVAVAPASFGRKTAEPIATATASADSTRAATKTAEPSPPSPADVGLLPSVAPGAPALSKTKLVFSDEFNGTTLDPNKWSSGRYALTTAGDGPFNPKLEGAYYASSQVTVSNGNAYLTVAPSQATVDGKTYDYVSGMIQSENRFALTPDTYVEARVRVNECSGCWDAFWAQPSGRWPPEVDIFEFFQPESAPKYNFHPEAGGQSGPSVYGEPNTSYFDGYHTYGMLWDGVHATPYLDGKPYAAQTGETRISMYLILNLAVYHGTSPAPGSNMAIDWVRAWQ